MNETPEGKVQKQGDEEKLRIHGWEITVSKSSMILKAEEIEKWTRDLAMKSLPEMIFGKSWVKFHHEKTGFTLVFNAYDALNEVNKHTIPIPKVAHSTAWIKSKQSVLESGEVSTEDTKWDWTFTSPHKGTLHHPQESLGKPERTTEKINIEKLKMKEPILFYTEQILYEDELADNGISQLTLKMRVMPSGYFVLYRLWIRIDGVLFRLLDTRVHHLFDSNYILREWQYREGSYQQIEKMMPPDPVKYNDPNIISPLLSLKESYVEKIVVFEEPKP